MEQVIINTYSFSELSEKAKQRAINDWRENEDGSHLFEEAKDTLDAFCDTFGIRVTEFCFTEMYRSRWSFGSIDNDILEMSGLRLQKYIWNNYKSSLYKGKYYSTAGHYDANGNYHYKKRHSNCQLENSCVLTGVCYDDSVLKPIYDFLNSKDIKSINRTTLEDLLNECLYELAKDVNSEWEYIISDEAIAESIESNELRFLQDGKQFY